MLVEEKFLYEPFWKFQANPRMHRNWKTRLAKDKKRFFDARIYRSAQEATEVLDIIFSRLYVLRNQMMHGSATWKSKLNRPAVRRGTTIMRKMLPIFIDMMMDNPTPPPPAPKNWGKPWYFPVVEQ